MDFALMPVSIVFPREDGLTRLVLTEEPSIFQMF